METINEVIVVEGRDDEINLKRFFNCEIIKTNGFGISKKTYELIKLAQSKKGVIILTDPDHAGEMIRTRISNVIPNIKHAFLNRDEATKNGNIGVENASEESLIKALKKVRVQTTEQEDIFDKWVLSKFDLIGSDGAQDKRELLGESLGIGYCNGKQLLKRLNNYGITMEEFIESIKEIEKNNG